MSAAKGHRLKLNLSCCSKDSALVQGVHARLGELLSPLNIIFNATHYYNFNALLYFLNDYVTVNQSEGKMMTCLQPCTWVCLTRWHANICCPMGESFVCAHLTWWWYRMKCQRGHQSNFTSPPEGDINVCIQFHVNPVELIQSGPKRWTDQHPWSHAANMAKLTAYYSDEIYRGHIIWIQGYLAL